MWLIQRNKAAGTCNKSDKMYSWEKIRKKVHDMHFLFRPWIGTTVQSLLQGISKRNMGINNRL